MEIGGRYCVECVLEVWLWPTSQPALVKPWRIHLALLLGRQLGEFHKVPPGYSGNHRLPRLRGRCSGLLSAEMGPDNRPFGLKSRWQEAALGTTNLKGEKPEDSARATFWCWGSEVSGIMCYFPAAQESTVWLGEGLSQCWTLGLDSDLDGFPHLSGSQHCQTGATQRRFWTQPWCWSFDILFIVWKMVPALSYRQIIYPKIAGNVSAIETRLWL